MLRAKTSKAEHRGRRQAPRGMAIAAREPEGGFVRLSPKPCRSCARAVGRMGRRSCARADDRVRVPLVVCACRRSYVPTVVRLVGTPSTGRVPGEVERRAKSSAGRSRVPGEDECRSRAGELPNELRNPKFELTSERSRGLYLASDLGSPILRAIPGKDKRRG